MNKIGYWEDGKRNDLKPFPDKNIPKEFDEIEKVKFDDLFLKEGKLNE